MPVFGREYVWNEDGNTPISTCPTNTGHTVDANSAYISETRGEEVRKIWEGDKTYEQRFRIKGYRFEIPQGVQWHYSANFAFPYDISLGNAELVMTSDHDEGDIIDFVMGLDTDLTAATTLGTSAQMDIATSTVDVGAVNASQVKIGQFLRLDDGTTNDDIHQLGEIIGIAGSVITVSGEASANIAAGANIYLSL